MIKEETIDPTRHHIMGVSCLMTRKAAAVPLTTHLVASLIAERTGRPDDDMEAEWLAETTT